MYRVNPPTPSAARAAHRGTWPARAPHQPVGEERG